MKFLHPSISLDDLEVLLRTTDSDGFSSPGIHATWINRNAEEYGVSERIPATVIGIQRDAEGRRLRIRSREERNGSERTFDLDLDEKDPLFKDWPMCGAFNLFIGERPAIVDEPAKAHERVGSSFQDLLREFTDELREEYPVDAEAIHENRRDLAAIAEKSSGVRTGVALILTNDKGEVLMGKRKGSHGAGTYSFIGGWMEHGEHFLDTAIREAKEEADIEVRSVTVVNAMSTVFPEGKHSVTVLLAVQPRDWSGTPKAMEPNKLDGEWGWYHPNNLPSPLFKPLADLGPALIEMLT